MSRGYWDYRNEYLKNEIFGYEEKYIACASNVFEDEEISELVFDIFDLLYAFDSYKCGDTGEGTWLADKAKFKEKWFGKSQDERVNSLVDKVLNQTKSDILKTFNIYNKCVDCSFAKPEKERVYCEKQRWSPDKTEPACELFKGKL